MKEALYLVFLTLLPFLELRASIPYGIINTKLSLPVILLTCILTNILLGPAVYLLIDKFVHLFLKIKWFESVWDYYVNRVQIRIKRYVEKYGELGVAIFIGVPLPGSGSYSGAIGSYLIGLGMKKFIIANVIGVLIAAALVSAATLSGSAAFHFFVKMA